MALLFVCYPRCSTCKKAQAWLDDHGIAYTFRDITKDRPTADELRTWKQLADVPIRRLFNTSGTKYRELGVKAQLDAGMSDEDAIELLATDGMLVKRPVLVGEEFAFFGFKAPEWEARLLEA